MTKLLKVAVIVITLTIFSACGSKNAPSPVTAQPTATSLPTAQLTPKNGDYPGKGKVTKINNELGSVEMNHEEIVGVMPPMLMEFYVTDKALLKGLKVGDNVDFILKYEDGRETISKITKVK